VLTEHCGETSDALNEVVEFDHSFLVAVSLHERVECVVAHGYACEDGFTNTNITSVNLLFCLYDAMLIRRIVIFYTRKFMPDAHT